MQKSIIVIGAGASGMTAAIQAAGKGHHVTILEKKEQPGKKLLVTGNGRCNFTNESLDESCYKGHDSELIKHVLSEYPTEKILQFFEQLGLLFAEKNGCYYPYTNQAQSVLQVLMQRLKALDVSIMYNVNVLSAVKEGDVFKVQTQGSGTYQCDALIVSCGSEAGVKDPRAFSGYQIARGFGHQVYASLPVLTYLTGNEGTEAYWEGVRANGRVYISEEGVSDSAQGEIQFTKSGISGIPVFQISHTVVTLLNEKPKYDRSGVTVKIDFFPGIGGDELFARLKAAALDPAFDDLKISEFLNFWLPKKIIVTVLKRAEISGKKPVSLLTEQELVLLSETLKSYEYRVTGCGDYLSAQSVSGGVDTSEVNTQMESKLVPGLYFTGEMLDVDGICGGYNLHFAWATGMTAGKSV